MAEQKPNTNGSNQREKSEHLNSLNDNSANWLLVIVICLAAFTTISAIVFFITAVTLISDIIESKRENASLHKLMEIAETEEEAELTFDEKMLQINSDYICWISIDGTLVDYPVVRGGDNEKYLHTSFYGEENLLGALFMDYRCEGEYVPNIIIYGHNSKHGDMFGGLRYFLDEQYMAERSIITLKANDRTAEYEIFSARKTDITDPAYTLDFSAPYSFSAFAENCGAPALPGQIITLSTCVSGNDKDERVIVQGALIGSY